jgi:hypothetical protein
VCTATLGTWHIPKVSCLHVLSQVHEFHRYARKVNVTGEGAMWRKKETNGGGDAPEDFLRQKTDKGCANESTPCAFESCQP